MERQLSARVASVVLGLLAVELAVRGWVACGGGPEGGPAEAVRRAAAGLAGSEYEERSALDSEQGADPGAAGGPGHADVHADPDPEGSERVEGRFLHPYSGWAGEGFDERMARVAESFEGDDGGRIDVVIAGGSVAAMFLRNYTEDLIDAFGRDPRFAGREVRVLNLSTGGLRQPAHLTRVALALAAGWRPDAVLLIDGYNELVFAAQNALLGVEPAYPSFSQWGPLLGEQAGGAEVRRATGAVLAAEQRVLELAASLESSGLDLSAAVSGLAWLRLQRLLAQRDAAARRLVELSAEGQGWLPGARGMEPGDPRLLAEAVRVWAEHARSLRALCELRGIGFVHVLQPTRDDEGSKPLLPEELEDRSPEEWIWAVREGYPLLRAAGAELLAEGEVFVDASRVFEGVDELLYRDRCHYNTRGNILLGARVMPALLDAVR